MFTEVQEQNINIAKNVFSDQQFFNLLKNYNEVREGYISIVEKSLEESEVKNPDSYETIDIILLFFRERLKELKEGKHFLKAFEYEKIFNLDTRFPNNKIKNFHLINFNLKQGLIPTMPEMLIFFDLINSWNILIESCEKYQNSIDEKKEDIFTREAGYLLETTKKNLIVTCVTFSEAYLHYLFSNFKYSKLYTKSIPNKKDRAIDDKDILEMLSKIFKFEDNFEGLVSNYEELLKKRNSIIHTTIIIDESTQRAMLEYQFNLSIDDVIEAIILCFNLIYEIEKTIPEEQRLLYWIGENFSIDEFRKLKKINPIDCCKK